jgi:hypothetical protein
LNIPLIATDPEYRITGSNTTTYPVRKRAEVIVFVVTSNLFAKNCGTVVSPPLRYRGKRKTAVTTMAIAANVSQAITDNPSLYALPLSPTICSVDRFVKRSDPAITPAVRLLPPRKYPSEEVSSVVLVAKYEMMATMAVKPTKDKIPIIVQLS